MNTRLPLVIIPAFNEVETIGAVVTSVRQMGYPVVVIDDGSSDRTFDVALSAGATALRLPINLGVGGALKCGFRAAVERGYDTVVQIDGDGQHDPAYISALLDELGEFEADMVIGSRFKSPVEYQMGILRRTAISILAGFASRSSGTKISDPSSGFRAIRQPLLGEFARNFPQLYLGDTFEALIVAAKAGYRIREIPVVMRHRQGGQPSAGSTASVRYLLRVVTMVVLGATSNIAKRSEH